MQLRPNRIKRKLAAAEAKVEAIKTADKDDKKAAAGDDAPTAPTKEVASAPAAATTATTTQAPNVLAWSIAGSGVVSGAIAVMLYLDVLGQRSELDALYGQVDAKGKITGISHEEASNKSLDIETTNTTAAILGGVGVVATGMGAYMLLGKPSSSVAIRPGLDLSSVVVTMQF